MNTPPLEFWFEFASNYSYLSVMRIEREAARLELSVQCAAASGAHR
jgi:2-hydroxychromene-2-carboxylate isomerase